MKKLSESMKTTINDIVEDLVITLPSKDKKMLLKDFSSLQRTCLGRYIRNTYELWTASPLTHNWRNHINRTIVNGIDYSYEHPDNIAGIIADLLIERLKQ
jgi:hypothetical protein